MYDYIIGLGISVKICKIYNELTYMTLIDDEKSDRYYDLVGELEKLLVEEMIAYDKLNYDKLYDYLNNITSNVDKLDNIKTRYYNQLRERIISSNKTYPYCLETAIVGKILLDTLKKVEKNITDIINSNSEQDNSLYELLYTNHKLYKYNLISSNSFLEQISIKYNFDVSSFPDVNFISIKNDFKCNDNFLVYLNSMLYAIAKDLIYSIINGNYSMNIDEMYSSLFILAELEIIISYLSKEYLVKLEMYCSVNMKIQENTNIKYIYNLLRKRKKENN